MNLAFEEEDEAEDFYHDGQIALPKAKVINPGQPNEERGYILLQKCFHDDQPPSPCETIHLQEPTAPPP